MQVITIYPINEIASPDKKMNLNYPLKMRLKFKFEKFTLYIC